jgi:choline dehydrogenase-like flavoprotein
MKFRGMGDRRRLSEQQPIQATCSGLDEWNSKFFVSDKENPYVTEANKPFLWIRGRQLGGRSIIWGRQSYRWSDLDFEANLREGIAVDWPIRYKDIAPWYDYVEDFAGISGQAEGLPQLPDGHFLPPMEMNCAELIVKDGIAKHYKGERLMTIGRTAILTKPHGGRAACHYCGPCARGCITRSYFSSINATLPAARATGKLTIRPFSVVHSLIFDPSTRKISGLRVIDGQTREAIEFKGRIVFLCASAIESARILLNSATAEFPDGLANSSGELGHNLMDHVMGGGASGEIPGNEDRVSHGHRPNGIYVPRFRNVKKKEKGFLRGYGYQGSGSRAGWDRGGTMPGFGAEYKHAVSRPGPWTQAFYGFGECLPNHENFVSIDKSRVDAWGIPVARINCMWRENERAILNDMRDSAAEMLEAVGAKNVTPYLEDNAPGLTIHEMGTARMGRDPKTSVLNGHNQAHDVANLFMTDGACMVSSSCVNPSLTYMALTARACNYAVEKLKQGEL